MAEPLEDGEIPPEYEVKEHEVKDEIIVLTPSPQQTPRGSPHAQRRMITQSHNDSDADLSNPADPEDVVMEENKEQGEI